MYSAATWALEGYCDSLAYEVAPFNIKVTVVQPNMEVQALTNRLTFAPQIGAYTDAYANAPSVRDIFLNVLNSDPETAVPEPPPPSGDEPDTPDSTSLEAEIGQGSIISRYPKLPPSAEDTLVGETVHALTAIGGLENPPLRHIVGHEAAAAVKEKLQTVTEEMEEFVDASLAVDIFESPLKDEAKRGQKPDERPPDAEGASSGV